MLTAMAMCCNPQRFQGLLGWIGSQYKLLLVPGTDCITADILKLQVSTVELLLLFIIKIQLKH